MSEDIDWIRKQLARTGKPQKVIGEVIQRDAGVVSRIMAGERALKKEEWDKIRAYFESEPAADSEPERTKDGDLRLPVYGSARGGLDGDYINTDSPIGWRSIPDWLVGVQNPAALRISGDSMEPRYYDGELLWADPSRPVRRGDFVLLDYKDGRGVIKRYIGPKGDTIEVEQFNPPKKMTVRKDELRRIVRIAGTLEE